MNVDLRGKIKMAVTVILSATISPIIKDIVVYLGYGDQLPSGTLGNIFFSLVGLTVAFIILAIAFSKKKQPMVRY